MYKKLLTKELFKDNPYLGNSVQRFIYSTLLYEGYFRRIGVGIYDRRKGIENF